MSGEGQMVGEGQLSLIKWSAVTDNCWLITDHYLFFGEFFPAQPETEYKYVVATVEVKEQKLKLFLDKNQVEEYKYR
jgi:hypothetical protein